MGNFVDVYAPPCMRVLERPVVAAPRWNVTIQVNSSGAERRNQNWENPLWSFTLPEAVREQAHFEDILTFWLALGGPFKSFPWRNPLELASCHLVLPNKPPVFTLSDQALGVGDGLTRTFQLRKVRTYAGLTYSRDVHLPILADLLIGVDGAPASAADYAVSRPGGVVTFDAAPPEGAVLTWGGVFDHEVRFADDRAFQAVVRGRRFAGFSDVNLEEVRPC
ncbi:MAG TPA: DUF2460 domain-containing protein [Phenylobacterium sp.]